MTKVAFLGPVGTYSHQAVLQQFPQLQSPSNDDALVPLKTIPDCFAQIMADDSLDYCVVPLENSTNGQVVFTYDLIRDNVVKSLQHDAEAGTASSAGEAKDATDGYSTRIVPPLSIVAEQYVAIEHCLISAGQDQQDTVDDTVYENLYSHPQVWGQVSQYLETTLKGKYLNKIDCTSTAEAIKLCLKDQKQFGKKSLAIGSKIGSILNGAHIIEEGINDLKGNTTRFLVLQKQGEIELIDGETTTTTTTSTKTNHPVENKLLDSSKNMMTLLTFTTQREGPGSLVDVLSIFQKYNINMTSISSRPSGVANEKNWSYIFYVEYEFDASLPWKQEILPQIDSKCNFWCMWGVFNRNDGYYKNISS